LRPNCQPGKDLGPQSWKAGLRISLAEFNFSSNSFLCSARSAFQGGAILGPEESENSGETRSGIPSSVPRLGSTVVFEGDFSSAEDIVIQARMKGSLHLQNASLYIDRKALVEASVLAKDVFIYGTMISPVQAGGRVFLAAEADMQGDITADRLSVENGARFRGGVMTGQGKADG
jgi:cytoskeletal protein CcmA (bactofilin family)